jgi:PPE-repeat protein
MVFDFAARPPEVNSALIYAGAGSAPMMAAAAGWYNLAAELITAAISYESVVAELAGGEWLGPASLAMATAVEPYVEWMYTTATAAERAAEQATASAAAYQTAYAMTVPPPLIAANRAQLAALVATNVLGQNTPAILANEAQYAAMWAQDAAAMYGYAAASASAAALNPLKSPAATTNPAGAGAQGAAVSTAGTQSQLNQLVSAVPTAMQGLAAPAATGSGIFDSPDGFLNDIIASGSNIGIWNDAVALLGAGTNAAAWNGFQAIATAVTPSAAGSGAAAIAPAALGAGLAPALAGSVAPAGTASLAATPVMASLGQTSTVAGMSVPATWSAATPESGSETLTAANWTPDVDEGSVTNVATGMPATASTGRSGYGVATPRYGLKPTVMPTRPLV